jgi:hypothetical protein
MERSREVNPTYTDLAQAIRAKVGEAPDESVSGYYTQVYFDPDELIYTFGAKGYSLQKYVKCLLDEDDHDFYVYFGTADQNGKFTPVYSINCSAFLDGDEYAEFPGDMSRLILERDETVGGRSLAEIEQDSPFYLDARNVLDLITTAQPIPCQFNGRLPRVDDEQIDKMQKDEWFDDEPWDLKEKMRRSGLL